MTVPRIKPARVLVFFSAWGLLQAAGMASLSCMLAAQTITPDARIQSLEQEVKSAQHRLMDWAGLNNYGSEDTEIHPPAAGENRVVFFGDDTIELWGVTGSATFFPGKPYFNRGVARQTTPQMLIRFRQDVVSLKPKVVVIGGGSNDLAGFAGPQTQVMIDDNIASMTEIAKANGIRVVLASVTPVCDCYANQTARRPPGKIIGLNGSIKRYAAQSGSVYLNYYSSLVDGREFKKGLTDDGLHPNHAGYQVMAPLAEKAISDALAQEQ